MAEFRVVVINPRETDPFARIRTALADTRPLLERMGEILEAESREAFEMQRFGPFTWDPRYPNQDEPFINIAGALADFSQGRTEPKARRFQRRPVLQDTGSLALSPKSRVSGPRTVEVGSTHPAAAVHQWGLVSHQKVDQPTKNRIAKWLLKKGRPYRSKLSPLLQPALTGWDTEVVQRPFLGVTRQAEDDIARTVEEMVAEAANGGDE